MPGNELGERVHNFFAQDNSSQGQHQPYVLEGNWPVPNNNFWGGSQRQIDVLNSSRKIFSSQNSEIDRGQLSYPVHAADGSNVSQSNQRHDFSKSQSLNEQQFSNGFIYGNQFYQTMQNETTFLTVDADSDQRQDIASRGLSIHGLHQGSGHGQLPKASDRSDTTVPPVSFDLFGGQQHMSRQQATMLQALQHQQSGLNDMQQQQQQLMIRKMQELQRQHQIPQLDRHQNLINQVSSLTKQASGSQSSLVNGIPNSDALHHPPMADPSTNWLSCGSSVMHSPSGIAFPLNLGQTQCSIDLEAQQVDQSLYGVPVANSRGLAVSHYSQMATERSSMHQLSTSSNSLHDNQHNFLPDQISGHEGTSLSRQKFQNQNSEHASSQSLNSGMMDMGFFHQANSLQKNATQQEIAGRQELVDHSQTSHERSRVQASSHQDEDTLDPTERKILYGSDDNISAAFGKSPNTSAEAGNLFDTGGLSNGFLSIQSGSWSALMQSAVAETCSDDVGQQEEWSGLIFHNADGSSTNQFSSIHNDNVKQVSFPNDSVSAPSALSSGSVVASSINTLNPMGLNQLGHTLQKEHRERVPTDISQRFGLSLEEASKWLNHNPVQNPVAEGSQIHGSASQISPNAERNAKTSSAMWAPGHSGTRSELNGRNALATGSPGGDRVLNIHVAEESQDSQNNQVRLLRGEVLRGKMSSSAIELGSARSVTGNHQANKGVSSFHDATHSMANSCNTGVGDGASPFVQNNYVLNQWKNASPSAKFQGGEVFGRMMDQVNKQNQGSLNSCEKEEFARHDKKNCSMKKNSTDSHRSNLSRNASGAFRESGLLDASDSRSLHLGKEKSTSQLTSKVTVPRKFHYHPMGNLDEDVEPTYDLKQPIQGQAITQQNSHFGQSKLFGQVSKNSTERGELPKDYKGPDKEPSVSSFPGYAPCTSVPFSQPFDSYKNKASSPSQNMLELLHKVDQSADHVSVVHISSSECYVSSQLSKAEKIDGSAQHSQSSFSRGFGLQLGPPSQILLNPGLSPPAQNAQPMFNSTHSSHAGTEMGEKGLLMASTSSLRSLSFPNEESQVEYENDRSAGIGSPGTNNTLHEVPGNYYPAFISDTSYLRSQLQNKQITLASGKVASNQHNSSFSWNTSHSMQRESVEAVLPDTSGNLQKDSLASSVGTAKQTGPYDVQQLGPSGTASTRHQMVGPQHFGLPGISRHGASGQFLHDMRINVPTSQHTLAAQYLKAPHFSELPQPNIVESSSQCEIDDSKGGHISSNSSAIHANPPVCVDGGSPPKIEVPLGRASSIKDNLDDSPSNSSSTQKEIEAFGRSLKPNMSSNEKYALLSQMRSLKEAETDPNIRFSKRIKGTDNILDIRQANLIARKQNEDNVEYSLASSSGVPSEDSRTLHFFTPSETFQRNTSPHEDASEDMLAAGLQDSQCDPSDCTVLRVEHHSFSPQMAPSWLKQYGSFSKWQMLPMHSARMVNSLRPEDSPITPAKSSSIMDASNLEDKSTDAPVDACQVGSSLWNSAPTSEGNGCLSSPQSLQPNVTTQHQVILRPKKRKSATSELHPWYKEISDGSQSLSILSVAEADWSKATNRLMEKVEDDVELIVDGPSLFSSKRRLVLATQLVQQLLSPPPATILSADASSEYETVAYVVSRMALGDACPALSSSSNLALPLDGMDLYAVKGKLNGHPHSAKAVEDLLGKAMKLENDFLRLDKCLSILDLRLDCQDLEKFSVINRFAKFHGRGQTDTAETSSTDATASTHKPCAQRYVTAVPLARSLPDMSNDVIELQKDGYDVSSYVMEVG